MTERKEGSTYPQSEAVSAGRRQNALVHGVRSETYIRNVARGKRRALLRKLGRKAVDLDMTSMVLVDLLARALAKLQMLDEHYARTEGIVREDGTPTPTLTLYFTAHNAARLTAGRLAEHLARQGDHAGQDLDDYITATYTRGGNGDDPHDE